jgi:hypothetical protein
MNEKNYTDMYGPTLSTFYDKGFIPGRMISGSKTFYRKNYPNNEVYFNANIFVLDEGKIWWGDLDLTRDKEILEDISISCGKKLYVLRELDGRFENEAPSNSFIMERAIAVIG